MKHSIKLAREYKWLEYESIRFIILIGLIFIVPILFVIIYLFDETNGFKISFEIDYFDIVIISIIFVVLYSIIYYIFRSTAEYEIGCVHMLYPPKFKKPLLKFLNKSFELDNNQDYYKPPSKNFKVLGLYNLSHQDLKIQVQYFSNPPLQRDLVEIRIGRITEWNYSYAAKILKSINNECLKYENDKD